VGHCMQSRGLLFVAPKAKTDVLINDKFVEQVCEYDQLTSMCNKDKTGNLTNELDALQWTKDEKGSLLDAVKAYKDKGGKYANVESKVRTARQ